MILSHVMRSRIAFVAGDVDRALHTLAELEDIGYTRKLLRVAVAARLERARLLMMQGSGPAAQEELQRAAMDDIWARERTQRLLAHDLDYLELAQLRWTLEFGDAASAVGPLTRELEVARLGGRNRRVVKIQLLRAMALQAAGQGAAAMDNLAQVLRVCGQEGYVRTVLDEGPAAAVLVRQFAHMRGAARVAEPDPIMADHLDRLLQAFGPAPPAVAENPGAGVPDGLTAKEIHVLELLGEGYSNSGMAEKLFVSDSTVRTHLRNLNLKLGANSRTHAVAIARKRGLIR
jgi:LuxR family maltose regulon positive regulatory protein